MQFFDKLHNPILVGSYIAYGHALGRCAGLRVGKVLAIEIKPKNVYGQKPIAITVWGIDDDYVLRPEDDLNKWHEPAKLCKTKGVLQFPDRILVLNNESVPTEYKQLLDPISVNTKIKNGKILLEK